MLLPEFIKILSESCETIQFEDTMAVIDDHYDFTPSSFVNGELSNVAGENSGSCKLFAFAQLQNFTEVQTLQCFGRYYREDVMRAPNGDSHQNIRHFIKTGWDGIRLDSLPLQLKED